jgi:hypothetical protein
MPFAKYSGNDLAGLADEPKPETSTGPNQERATGHQEDAHVTKSANEGKGDKGTPSKIQYRPIPESWQGLDEATIERLCIATVDGGLSDAEAERRVL